MAEETMVDPRRPFFEAVLKLVRRLNRNHGPLYLAVLMQFKDRPQDEWTLLVGSQSLVRDRPRGLKSVAASLAQEVPKEHGSKIRRIAILQQDDPFFVALATALSVSVGGMSVVENCVFNDIEIAHAAFFVTKHNVGKARADSARNKRSAWTATRKNRKP